MRVALVAGETSGDLLGAGLMRELKCQVPDIRFEGVAGPAMEAAGCVVIEPAESLAVMGLIEPLKEIPRLLRLRRSLYAQWTKSMPDVFVGIDAPDFNLGLEKQLRHAGIPTVHYVSPSVWAWRQGRINSIRQAADRVLCLLPFEKSFYDDRGIAADFVGHPMADAVPVNTDAAAARRGLGLRADSVVAVLPGSRMSEVSRLGPVFAAVARTLAATRPGLQFVAPMATARIHAAFRACLEKENMLSHFLLTDGNAEQLMIAADVVLLASGTASLQAALLGRPMVAAYKLAPITYAIAKGFGLVKVPYFTLPNLLTDEALVPEFLQSAASAANLAAATGALLDDQSRRDRISAAFRNLRSTLAQGADRRAAAAVLALARAGSGQRRPATAASKWRQG